MQVIWVQKDMSGWFWVEVAEGPEMTHLETAGEGDRESQREPDRDVGLL